MLKRENRFSFKRSIPRKTFITPHFVLRFQNDEEGGLRAAVIVGKKVDKRAVERNKIKRMIVKNLKEVLPTDKNLTLILYTKKSIATLTSEKIKENLVKALKNIQLI